MIWTALILLSTIVWVLGLHVQGLLDSTTATLSLFALAAIAGVSRAAGISIWQTTMRIALPLASLATFAILFGEQQMLNVAGAAILLLIVLFGIFIMFGGLSKNKTPKR